MKETQEEKNERRISLFQEIGILIGPIIERETTVDRARTTDCVDCLLTHIVEVLAIYYELPEEISIKCYKEAQKSIQTIIDEFQTERASKPKLEIETEVKEEDN